MTKYFKGGIRDDYISNFIINVVLKSKIVNTLLLDCKDYYGNKPAVFAVVDTAGIELTKLGTLGERIISNGIDPDANVATHFLVFGKGKKK